jgi:ABC-type multidrug transport system ATPase subunit
MSEDGRYLAVGSPGSSGNRGEPGERQEHGKRDASNAPILILDRVSKRVGTRTIIDNVSFEVAAGELVAISGQRGAGKRKLLDLIVGNEPVDSGRIVFDGQDVTKMSAAGRRRLGMASPLQEGSFYDRVREAVRPRSIEERLAAALADVRNYDKRERVELIEEMLSSLGLQNLRKYRPSQTSAGERQRAGLAEILIRRPKMIVLDEPLKAVDRITASGFIHLLRSGFFASSGARTAILLSDRSGDSRSWCDRQYRLHDGKLGIDELPLKIFINYRRSDDPGFAHALFQQLKATFDARQLFMDVEGQLKPGDDYGAVLESKVTECDILLVIIGPRWLAAADEHGRRRLENADDWVRIEIISALDAGKTVVPVLVGGADVPREDDLPEPLKPLSRRQAVRIDVESFGSDAQRLARHLHTVTKG